MDDNVSYPLVVLPPEQGTLVPVAAEVIVDLDSSHHSAAGPDLREVVAFL